MCKENRIRKNAACSFAVFVFPLVALLCVSCQSPAGGDISTPAVNSVTIADYPAIKWLVPGETAKFLATIDAQGGADDTVKWEVTAPPPSAGKHHGTAISSPSGNKIGELSVDKDEEAISLTVTATSVADETKSASKTFSVLDFKGVEIRPWEFEQLKVAQGKSFTFSAINDSEENITDKAVWTIVESHSPSTGIDRGVLTVAPDEAQSFLAIMAKDMSDNTKYAKIRIRITDPAGTGLIARLPEAKNLTFSDRGVASWAYPVDDGNVQSYSVQLYKGDAKQGDAVSISRGVFTCDFLGVMRAAGVGNYSFTVTAIGNGTSYKTSDESGKSGTQAVTQRAAVQYTWWYNNTPVAQWDNPDDSGDYTVRLIDNATGTTVGSPMNVPRESIPSLGAHGTTGCDFVANGFTLSAGVAYKFGVIAKGDAVLKNDSTETVSAALVITPLDKPAGLWWDGNTAKWTAVANASSYSVQLYKNNGALEIVSQTGITNDNFDFATALSTNGKGVYTFNVTAVGTGTYSNSPVSEKSYAKYHFNLTAQPDAGSKFGANSVKSIAYNGTNTYVAVGSGGTIIYSGDDGLTWNTADTLSNAFSSWVTKPELRAVVWGGDSINKFVAVGQWGTILRSDNGINWTLVRDTGDDPFNGWGIKPELYAVAYGKVNGNGIFILGGGSISSGARTAWSTNGTSWTFVENASFDDNAINRITYGSGKFIAVGNNGKAAWTSDGTSWSDGTKGSWIANEVLGAGIAAKSIAHNGSGIWVIVGEGGKIARTTGGDPTTGWSTDGINSRFEGTTIWSVVWGNGMFVAVGDGGRISTSPDGKEWTAVKQTFTTEGITALASAGTEFLLGGYNGSSSKFAFSD